MCDQLARNLSRQYGAAAIHGDKSQPERDSVLSDFRSGRCPVLVATDVAARGLDVKDIRFDIHLSLFQNTIYFRCTWEKVMVMVILHVTEHTLYFFLNA